MGSVMLMDKPLGSSLSQKKLKPVCDKSQDAEEPETRFLAALRRSGTLIGCRKKDRFSRLEYSEAMGVIIPYDFDNIKKTV